MIGLVLLLTRKILSIISVRWKNLVNVVTFISPFMPKFYSGIYKVHFPPTVCVTVTNNDNEEHELGGGIFVMMDGRKKSRTVF